MSRERPVKPEAPGGESSREIIVKQGCVQHFPKSDKRFKVHGTRTGRVLFESTPGSRAPFLRERYVKDQGPRLHMRGGSYLQAMYTQANSGRMKSWGSFDPVVADSPKA